MEDQDPLHRAESQKAVGTGLQEALYDDSPEPAAPTAYLKVFGPDIGIFVYPLTGGTVNIGRGREAQLRLPNRCVSRHHATLSCGIGQFILQDAGSTSGTTVDGNTFEKHVLRHGDTIEIGTYLLQFRTHEELPGVDEVAARAELLLRGNYCAPLSAIPLRYRILWHDPTSLFGSGETLAIGSNGLLIPTWDPPTEASCLEIAIELTHSITTRYLGELMGTIGKDGVDWMCVRLHNTEPSRIDAIVSQADTGSWINVNIDDREWGDPP